MKKMHSILLIFALFIISGFFDDSRSLSNHGSIEIILIMFIGGFLTAFTPCVYPLIPVTIGIISSINRENKKSPLLLSLIYASGIIITYTVLGVVAGLGSFTFGNYMGSPLFVWILFIIFFALGLSMTGFYEIQLPQSLTNRIVNIKGSGNTSVFLMGLVAGFVAAPCTGPILASALIYISTGGSPLLGGLYLFSYAAGLSIIFIVAGIFSGLLSKLPKSGRWMIVVRSIFAVAIISYALYLLNSSYGFIDLLNSMDRYHIIASILAIIGFIGGGLTREVDFSPLSHKLVKLIMVIFISIAFLSFSLSNHSEDKIEWITDYDTAINKAKNEKKPVIIDFYATWCAACKDIKNKTIPDRRIQEDAKRFIMIKLDVSSPDEKLSNIEKMYAVSGLPSIIFLDSELNEIKNLRITGFVDADDFLRRMKSVK